MELRLPLDEGDLTAVWDVPTASHPEALEAAVHEIVRAWAGAELADGAQGWWGFSPLTILQVEDGFRVCEPDFVSADPALDVVDHVSVTAQVAVMQRRFHLLTGLAVQPCVCAETLQYLDGVFELEDIVMVRSEASTHGDSGWLVLPARSEDAQRLQREGASMRELFTYGLLRARPHLLKALTHPAGSMITFRGPLVISVKDYDNVELLREPDCDTDPFWLPLPPAPEEEPAEEELVEEQAPAPADARPKSSWLDRIAGSLLGTPRVEPPAE